MAQYIDKSAVVAEIEKLSAYLDSFHEQRIMEKILFIIDTLEVKEVDINKEISQFIDTNFEKATIGHKLSLRRVAQHFFELGMQVNNPITKDGYKQGYADTIEKACELLMRMIWQVTYEDLEGNSVQNNDKMEFIGEFKNSLKGGNNGK